MSWLFVVFVVVNIITIGYLGLRLESLFNSRLILFVPLVISLLYLANALFNKQGNVWLAKLLNYSVALLVCAVFATVILDCILLINKFWLHLQLTPSLRKTGWLTMLCSLFIVGVYMAAVPKTAFYNISINKQVGVDKLRVVHLSDLHISEATDVNYIDKMVARVNELHPDIVVITGDLLDNRLKPFLDQQLAPSFAQINSQYGTFMVFGNHEYYGTRHANNSPEQIVAALKDAKITVLQDAIFRIADTEIIIVGRDDYAARLAQRKRLDLQTIIAGIDTDKTALIVLDHQPRQLSEPIKHGVDVLFSGHTHGGQLFPGTLLVQSMYQNHWGLYQQQRPSSHPFVSIVSSGYGLWGPPIRLLTRAEIVVADITFKPTPN